MAFMPPHAVTDRVNGFGEGHFTVPFSNGRIPFLGKATKNVSANEMMWAFFEMHPMR
jgi:hypothetical protein